MYSSTLISYQPALVIYKHFFWILDRQFPTLLYAYQFDFPAGTISLIVSCLISSFFVMNIAILPSSAIPTPFITA